MSLRSPTAAHPFWGTFATASALPNVSGSATQSTNLQAGDDAYVTAAGVRYVCTVATPGAAAWTAIAPYTGGSVSRNPADANHTNVWYLGQGCTNGTNITADVGGVTLSRYSGSGTATTGLVCFKSQQSLTVSQSVMAESVFSGTVSIATNQAFTIEAIVYVLSTAVTSIPTIYNSLALSSSVSSEGAYFRYHVSYSSRITSLRNPGSSQIGDYNGPAFGAAVGQLLWGKPHHYMMTWNPATPKIEAYIDGSLIGSTTDATYAGNRAGVIDKIYLQPWSFGVSLADVRISNIARPQSYAVAATQAMLRL